MPVNSKATGEAGFSLRSWLVLLTLCAAQFMVALDFSIVTVALPAIGSDLGFDSAEDLQWVMTACVLPTATLLLLFGRASDLLGRRRLFVAGLMLITAFSLVAGFALTPGMLVLARAGQGLAAAMVGPTALALLTATFEEGPRRAKALGVSGALLSLGFIVGTIGGGILTSALGWRANMGLLVVMGVVVVVGARSVLPQDTPGVPAKLDLGGAVLATAGLVCLVYGISEGGKYGWSSPVILGLLAGAIALLGAYLVIEGRVGNPLTPLSVLKRSTVKWAGLTGFVTFGMTGGTTILLSLYMQDVLGWSALLTGVGLLGEGVAAALSGVIAPRILARAGSRSTLVGGLVLQGLGILLMTQLPVGGDLALLLVSTVALGFGHVVAVVAFIATMTSGLPGEHQGLAGGLAQTAQQVGSAVGIAGLTAVQVAFVLPVGVVAASTALVAGLHAAFLVAAIVVGVSAVVALTRLGKDVAAASSDPARSSAADAA